MTPSDLLAPTKTLRDVLPEQFTRSGEYIDFRAYGFRNVEVAKEYSAARVSLGASDAEWKPWPGKHRNVHHWVELANGYAVGHNENPVYGWSFPVVRIPK